MHVKIAERVGKIAGACEDYRKEFFFKVGKIVGACEDCRTGFEKWGGLWVLVKTAERDSKSGEDCGCM